MNKIKQKYEGVKTMTNKEAIRAIKSNYPPENYSMLREALDLAIRLLEKEDNTPTEEDMFESMG